MDRNDFSRAVLRPVRVGDAFETTVEHLATAIRLGVFPRGELLPPERELAARLGIARVTLREAMAALRAAQMVQTRRGRGGGSIVVYDGVDRVISRLDDGAAAEPDIPRGAELAGVLDFRRVVDPGAAYLAASRTLTASQRAFLVQGLDEVTAASGRDAGSYRIADSHLHVTIAQLSGSAMLLDAVTRGQGVLHRLLGAIPDLPMNIKHSDDEHAAMVEAILAGNADLARAVTECHCDRTSALLRGLLG